MRNTFSACRSTSTAPMYTLHSIPSSAAAVALATPCWPAPVSATRRVLPIRLASSAWPSTLLILCEPVWLRSSRLSSRRMPSCSLRLAHSVSDRRTAGVVAEHGRRARRGRQASAHASRNAGLQLLARGHQCLGYETTTEFAETSRGRSAPPSATSSTPRRRAQSYGTRSGPRCCCGAAARARSMNDLTFIGSLRPGDFSTPDDDVDAPRLALLRSPPRRCRGRARRRG